MRQEVAEKKTDKHPEIRELLIALIERYKAVSPTQEGVYCIAVNLRKKSLITRKIDRIQKRQ